MFYFYHFLPCFFIAYRRRDPPLRAERTGRSAQYRSRETFSVSPPGWRCLGRPLDPS